MLRGLWYYKGDFSAALDMATGADTFGPRLSANVLFLKVAYHPDYPACNVAPVYIPDTRERIRAAHARGLLVCAEAYIVPRWAKAGGQLLALAVSEGADSALINAEAEWEGQAGDHAEQLVRAYRASTSKPLHLCSDFRGDRLLMPYHQTFWRYIDGAHPMVYHRAFYGEPYGDLQRAFDAVFFQAFLKYKDRMPRSVPIYPVIQGYGSVDWEETLGAVILAHMFGEGSSVYVAHDLGKRAELGVRDGWIIVESLRGERGHLTPEQKERILAAVREALG